MVQYQLPNKYCTLFQRFGRGVRDRTRTGQAILIIEQKYFDDTKRKAQEQIAKSLATREEKKRKAEEKKERDSIDTRESKQQRTDTCLEDEETKFSPASALPPQIAPVPSSAKGRSGGKQDNTVEDVMDQFINAHLRTSIDSSESGCRRTAGNQFFANPSNPIGTSISVCISSSSHLNVTFRGRRRLLLPALLSSTSRANVLLRHLQPSSCPLPFRYGRPSSSSSKPRPVSNCHQRHR